jgi:AhpD family alkylhydroperoxidase
VTNDAVQLAADVSAGVRLLRDALPEPMKAFSALAQSATATATLDTKTKELMALAISIAIQCDGCVAIHTKLAHRHGASRQEIAETIALAVYMGGGPASVYGAVAMRAYDQFSDAQQERVS